MDSMDDMKQIRHKLKKNSHLPKVDRYNMAQLQMDAVGLKGFTLNLMICIGRMSDVQDDVGMRSITEINYQCVNYFKALTSRSVFEQGSSISYHPKRETCKDIYQV